MGNQCFKLGMLAAPPESYRAEEVTPAATAAGNKSTEKGDGNAFLEAADGRSIYNEAQVKDADVGIDQKRTPSIYGEEESATLEEVEEEEEAPPIRRWQQGELLGRGAFGQVYMGMNLDTGELIAIKQVRVDVTTTSAAAAAAAEAQMASLEEEVHLMRSLRHPNIVRYLGTSREEGGRRLNIFLEFVPGGSIASLVAKFGALDESVVRVYTRQILLGLEYLHSNKIIHRDIKGANLLVDNAGRVKLADFGASRRLEDLATLSAGCTSVKGTPFWMAPEVIKQTGHGRQADIWSVGCTVLEMVTGKPPWSQYQTQVSALFHIAQAKGPPAMPSDLSSESRSFVLACLNRDPRRRPTASQLLQDPFVLISHGAKSPNSATAETASDLAWRTLGEATGITSPIMESPLKGLSPDFGNPKKRTKTSTPDIHTEGADSVLHDPTGKAQPPPHSPPRVVLSDSHSFDSARNKQEASPLPNSPQGHGLSDAEFKAMMGGVRDSNPSTVSGLKRPGDAILTWESTLDSLMESSNGVKESLCNIMTAIKENVEHCESAHQELISSAEKEAPNARRTSQEDSKEKSGTVATEEIQALDDDSNADTAERVGEEKRELWESELRRELEEQRAAAKSSVHSGLAHIRNMSRDAQRFRASKGLPSSPD